MPPPKLSSKIILVSLAFLMFSQCAEKTSDEYVKEGIAHTEHEEYEEALESFLNAVRKNPNNPEAFYSLGGIYNYNKTYEEAAEAFRTVIQLDPVHFNAYYSLGYTYEQLNRQDDAEKQFRRYRELKKKFDALLKTEQEKH